MALTYEFVHKETINREKITNLSKLFYDIKSDILSLELKKIVQDI